MAHGKGVPFHSTGRQAAAPEPQVEDTEFPLPLSPAPRYVIQYFHLLLLPIHFNYTLYLNLHSFSIWAILLCYLHLLSGLNYTTVTL